MVKEQDIVFVTTTLKTKWLGYQSAIIKKLFPQSEHILVDGTSNWPNSWFYWIDRVKETGAKYYVHIDEDFFIESKEEMLRCIDIMENQNVDLLGVPDGYHHYRGANPVAINTFLMFGRVESLKKVNFSNIMFGYGQNGWANNFGIAFRESYMDGFEYKHRQQGGSNFAFEQEPYYAFLWTMKELGCRFSYLYPHFDEMFKSTNPRIDEFSEDIGIHMWYTRQWSSSEDIHGMTNAERYAEVEKHLLSIHGETIV